MYKCLLNMIIFSPCHTTHWFTTATPEFTYELFQSFISEGGEVISLMGENKRAVRGYFDRLVWSSGFEADRKKHKIARESDFKIVCS